MSAAEVIDAARAAGVHLAVDGADLVLESPVPPPPAILDLVRVHKAEIIAAITVAGHGSQKTDGGIVDWRDWYEERAAIRQFDGGYTLDEAECLAWSEAEDRWRRADGDGIPREMLPNARIATNRTVTRRARRY
jgi:hypothetical protein